jgi:hypothetical protein
MLSGILTSASLLKIFRKYREDPIPPSGRRTEWFSSSLCGTKNSFTSSPSRSNKQIENVLLSFSNSMVTKSAAGFG